MARGLAGTNTQISGVTTIAKNQTHLTMAGWMRRGATNSIQAWGFNESNLHRTGFLHGLGTNNDMYVFVSNGVGNYAETTQNVTGWNHWALVFDGTQSTNALRLLLYRNGQAITLAFVNNVPSTTSNNVLNETLRIGRAAGNSVWSTGDFADLAIWQAALTAQQIASLADGFAADKVATDSLAYYSPLIRDIADHVGGMALTDASSTVQPHPRIYS